MAGYRAATIDRQRVSASIGASQAVAGERDALADALHRAVEIGTGSGAGHQGYASGIAFQARQRGRGSAIEGFVPGGGKHQHELPQRGAFGKRESRGIDSRRGVGHRIVINAHRCGGNGDGWRQRIEHHRAAFDARPGAVGIGAQGQAAGQAQAAGRIAGAAGQGDGRADVDVVGGTHHQIAVGHGNVRPLIDVTVARKQYAAVGGGDGRIDVDVLAAAHHQVAVGGGDGRIDVDVAIGDQGQRCWPATGRPGHCIVDEDVAILGASAVGGDLDVVGHQLSGQGRAGDVVARRTANGEVLRVDQPGAGPAGGRGRGDPHAGIHVHACSRRFHEAAIATAGCAGVQRPTHVDSAGLHVAQQQDAASAVLQGPGLDHAGVVDGGMQQAARGLRGHQYTPTICADKPAVFSQCIDRTGGHCHVQQAVAGHVHGDGVARGQCYRAQAGHDDALVADAPAHQRDVAAVTGGDAALIDDRARTRARERVFARLEVGIAEVHGRGKQAADIHRGSLSKKNAVRVQQEHPTVGIQVTQDQRGV